MKRIFLVLLSGVIFFLLGSPVRAAEIDSERITNFKSEIFINQDTSISIVENIDYTTPEEKHGIFRYIPEKYREGGVVKRYDISMIQVADGTGGNIPFETYRESGNVVIKIGDPDKTFFGPKKYRISYSVKDAVKRQNGFDELYWDITGEGWQFPVESTQVRVVSDHAEITETKCFTGPVGSTESNCMIEGDKRIVEFVTETVIGYGDNFTIAVKLNQNNGLIFPSSTQRMIEKIINNSPLALLFLPGIVMFIYWYKKGRDYRFVSPNAFDMDPEAPQGMKPIFEPVNVPMVYEPLKTLTPGEAGAILDERVDNQDVVSEIIDLARKKYLKIERVENKGFLKFGHDYLFTKLKEGTGLPEHQKYLLTNIFDSKKEVKMSELKGTFYTHMGKVKDMIYDNLTEKKLFTSKPVTALTKGIGLAIAMDVVVFALTIGTISFLGAAWPVGVLMATFIISLVFAIKMPQKTAIGTNFHLQAKGLRETIRLGKWREEIKEKHLFIEEVLPFAISFGVISKLTKDMEKLNIEPPKYVSGGFGTNTVAWSGFMNDFSKTASSGLSYNLSSSGSGRSGFSGGSSGGGGGGGGGGSW